VYAWSINNCQRTSIQQFIIRSLYIFSHAAMTTTVSVAVLDDYQSIANDYFVAIDPTLQITTFNDTISPYDDAGLKALVARLRPFQVISTMRERTPFTASLLRQLPNLRLLLTTGTQNASIDLAACKELSIVVAGGIPAYLIDSPIMRREVPDCTTTHCWALILGLARHIARDDRLIKTGGWQGQTLATQVPGRVLGLCGLGRLGTSVGRIAIQAWGMSVICWSTNLTQEKADVQARSVGIEAGKFRVVSKQDLFSEADVVSVHLVLSERSKGIVGKQELQLMKKTSLFINTSRGPLVDETALLDMCDKGMIAGVALDVFDQEPLAKDSRWRWTSWGEKGRAEVLLSPHMGFGETELIHGLYQANAENLKRWLKGEELNFRLV
jgi:phosphoglycerate dehydrogenase-like enzyme